MIILYQTKPNKRGVKAYLYIDHDKKYIDFYKREADKVITTTRKDIRQKRKFLKNIGYKSDYDLPLF